MRLSHSFSKAAKKTKKITWPLLGVAAVTTFLVSTSRHAYSPVARKLAIKADEVTSTGSEKPAPAAANGSVSGSAAGSSAGGPAAASQGQTPQDLSFTHLGITTTYFWVGEPGDADNHNIANSESTWDGQWKQNYGGVDDPTSRSNYQPAGFTPKENPFYFALPYSDIDDNGNRKASAVNCPNYPAMKNQSSSWCKNSWIAIRHAGKVVYAQWEDAGPYGEDDINYVFGTAAPNNKLDVKAGLDVSPAVHDYLGLGDVSTCDWGFVPAGSVPSGPWKQIVTTSPGDNTVN